MDDIVFADRNKAYGAYELRKSYNRNLLKAMFIVAVTFIFSMYTPAIAKNLGWVNEKKSEKLDSLIIIFDDGLVFEKELEVEVEKTKVKTDEKTEDKVKSIKNKEMEAVDKNKADKKLPPSKDDLKNDDKIDTRDNQLGETGKTFIEKLDKTETIKKKTIVSIADATVKPHFLGNFNDYVNDNVNTLAMDENSAGQATVYFILDENGKVIKNSVRIYKSSGYKDIDSEAIRLVKEQPKYSPGKFNEDFIQVECKVVIDFENRD